MGEQYGHIDAITLNFLNELETSLTVCFMRVLERLDF